LTTFKSGGQRAKEGKDLIGKKVRGGRQLKTQQLLQQGFFELSYWLVSTEGITTVYTKKEKKPVDESGAKKWWRGRLGLGRAGGWETSRQQDLLTKTR